jgi:hypothetical protein
MSEKKKTLLDKRIDQFCKSSAELLTGIHARHNSMEKGMSKGKRKRKRTQRKSSQKQT